MKHLGHPVFCDKPTGDSIVKGNRFSNYKRFVENSFKLINRQALHAKSLGFVHPKTKKKVYFDTELPEDIQNVISKWKKYEALQLLNHSRITTQKLYVLFVSFQDNLKITVQKMALKVNIKNIFEICSFFCRPTLVW